MVKGEEFTMIPISRLPYSVQIQTKTVDDTAVVPTETWATVATIQADIQPLSVTRELEQRQYGIIEPGIMAKMFCDPTDAVQVARRVVHNTQTYEINYVAAYKGHIEALLKMVVT